MNNKFLMISIGNNSNSLLGCENDAILFYNLNLSCDNLVASKYLLLGKNATLKNLQKIFKSNNDKKYILIFFSGHGFKGGCLNFTDGILKPIEIYDLINTNFIIDVNIYFILDCCYSGGFPQINNFNKIKNTFILASCKEDQKSVEIFVPFNQKNFDEWKPSIINKKIIVGLFTNNLVDAIKNEKIYDVYQWIKNSKIWEELSNISFQKIVVKK